MHVIYLYQKTTLNKTVWICACDMRQRQDLEGRFVNQAVDCYTHGNFLRCLVNDLLVQKV